ncbi:MAG: hypothetical protein FWH22_10375 [Fibromonadales bacterium]|nr:hypothetical protein [Fibromonadales bacterium]
MSSSSSSLPSGATWCVMQNGTCQAFAQSTCLVAGGTPVEECPPSPVHNVALSCPWQTLSVGDYNLEIGTDIGGGCTFTGSISNAEAADCGSVSVEVNGNTDNPGAIAVNAVATCSKAKQTLDTRTYTVVPDPSLGKCNWNTNEFAIGVHAEPTAQVIDSYGRCGNDEVSYGDFPRVLGEDDVGIVSNIKATITCNSGPLESPCDDLNVGVELCRINDFCEGAQLDWGQTNVSGSFYDRCFFTKNFSYFNVNAGVLINGESPSVSQCDNDLFLSICTEVLTNQRVNGGYYIRVTNNSVSIQMSADTPCVE